MPTPCLLCVRALMHKRRMGKRMAMGVLQLLELETLGRVAYGCCSWCPAVMCHVPSCVLGESWRRAGV